MNMLNFNTHDNLIERLKKICKSKTIYQVTTPFLCNYVIFQLPDTLDPEYAYIGPFTDNIISREDILNIAEKYQVKSENLQHLEKYYQNIPQLSNEALLIAVLCTLGEYMWGSMDNFSLEKITDFYMSDIEKSQHISEIQTPEEALLNIQMLEEHYEMQQQLMQAVASGQTHKAELCLAKLSSRQFESRASTPLRNRKNYTIVLNTILRIAAGNGAVHPTSLDSISSRYARKIESLTSEAELISLSKEMINKYCQMVKNQSQKGYSLLVRKTITRINMDLTADLSLKTQAELLSVNSSYLSTLFKKETGITLTEYVIRKRIDHALLLLSSSDMQIQLIAQHCGIPDVNYFTKTFKKVIGKTPKEYRESLSSRF
ncbi:helix-turn-helix domain-containing protein [Alloiococcus sp. CFN-8]|uniref:helix-turn-helix domain-containing protein n=1 Tax=Alloiococcus sp. CFN-8 TaxID=3416081 RepID=UPI003CEB767A